MRVRFLQLFGCLLVWVLAGLARPALADFDVAVGATDETYPAVASNPQTGESMVAYRVPASFGTQRLFLRRFDAQGNKLGEMLPPEYPFGPPPAPYQNNFTLIGRPAVAYSPTSDRYLVAVPQRHVLGGFDLVGVWLLDGAGVLQDYDLLFADSSPLYYPSPPGTLDEVGEHSALRIVHNSVRDEFVVTVQRSTLETDAYGNQVRWNGLWAQRVNASDGSLIDDNPAPNSTAKRLLNFEQGGVRSHTLAYAPVGDEGVYLLVASPWVEHSNGPRLLDYRLDPIATQDTSGDGTANFPLIPLYYGEPEPGLGTVTAFQAAYGEVEGRRRFLLVWMDTDNCRPGSCPTPWAGIWGTYIDPERRYYTSARDNTPFPISRLALYKSDGGWQYEFTPRVTYNPATRGFAVVWRTRPSWNAPKTTSRALTSAASMWIISCPTGVTGPRMFPCPIAMW